jgi:class I fructose-bisphosphate aldolase
VLTIDTYYDYTQQDGGGSHSLITTVEEAVRMGVDAVKMPFPWTISNSEPTILYWVQSGSR